MDTVVPNNPYVGPRSIKTGEAFFGRDREIRSLSALLIAERIVLLHSPSGAGKSSLIQAGLIPRMAERFSVLPLVRVNLEAPQEVRGMTGLNRYVLSTLLSLEEGLPPEKRLPLVELATLSLDAYLEQRSLPDDAPENCLLLLDQFEEVLTVSPTDAPVKQAFFEQLGEALQNRRRWALFAIREDYMGGLAPYVRAIPNRLNVPFRLGLLGPEAARVAIQQPAKNKEVDFTDEAAQKLVDDLRRIQVQQPDGSFVTEAGPNVEPVQLQVVCFNLWQSHAADDKIIDENDLQRVGSVDQALASYYANAMRSVAESAKVDERILRQWFDEHLITPEGIRSQVLKGAEASEGLPNIVLRLLENTHLVRGETRAGKTWYELSHDRLVQPVRQDNNAWFEHNLTILQRQAVLWDQQGRSEGLLLRQKALAEAEKEVSGIQLTPDEQAFLDACRVLRKREQQDIRQRQFIVAGLITSLIFLALSVAGFFRASQQTQSAQTAEARAVFNANAAATAQANAELEKQNALGQAKIAHAGELASYALLQLDTDPHKSVLSALEALSLADTPDAENSLRKSLVEDRLRTVFSGHDSWVASAVYSPDGKTILTSSGDGTARIWDQQTGNVLLELRGHQKQINSASFSRDGKLVLTASDDNTARIWEITKCNPDCPFIALQGHTKRVGSAIFSPNGSHIATASDDMTIRIWDLATGQMILALGGEAQKMNRVTYSPDGKLIAAAGEEQVVYICDATTGEILKTLSGHTDAIATFQFSSDGKYIATASKDHTARVWEVATGVLLAELQGHTDRLMGVSFSSDSRYLLTSSVDQTARVWEWRTAKLISELRGHTSAVNGAVFSRNDKLILTASSDHTARLWETFSGHSLAELRGHTSWVYAANFNPDGNHILTVSADGSARLWNANPAASLIELRGHTLDVKGAAFSPDTPAGTGGKYVVTASSDTTARVWESASGHIRAILSGHSLRVSQANFSPGGRFVVTASEDSTARVWDLNSCNPECAFTELKGHELGVKSARFSPDGKYIVTASNDLTARIWEWQTGKVVRVLNHKDWVWDAAFSPDGKFIVTASAEADPAATVWDVTTGSQVVKLSGHKDAITSVSFSPDGKLVVTASRDKTVRIWNWEVCKTQKECLSKEFMTLDWVLDARFSPTGDWLLTSSRDGKAQLWDISTSKLISELQGHTSAVNAGAFSPDGQFIVTASGDSTARIWPRAYFAPFDEVLKTACTLVDRELTPAGKTLCSIH